MAPQLRVRASIQIARLKTEEGKKVLTGQERAYGFIIGLGLDTDRRVVGR
jgi:hypothetical protein